MLFFFVLFHAGGWGVFFLHRATGWNLLRLKRPGPDDGWFYLGMAIVATIASLWLLRRIPRLRKLRERGDFAEGVIVKRSWSGRGSKWMVVEFMVAGKRYRKGEHLSASLRVGDAVDVLYDVERPRRCEIV
jgi:hypothetical protein